MKKVKQIAEFISDLSEMLVPFATIAFLYFMVIAPIILIVTDRESLLGISTLGYFRIWFSLFAICTLLTDASMAILAVMVLLCLIGIIGWVYLIVAIVIAIIGKVFLSKDMRELPAW